MKTIGMLGGMSWESTAVYYDILNKAIRDQLGGNHSAKCLLHSFDFHEIEILQHNDDWDKLGELLASAASGLEQQGAEILLICTNTMHLVSEEIENAISIPLIHIADVTAACLQRMNASKVALFGTKFTMEKEFYKGRLQDKYGFEVIIPNNNDRDMIHRVIFEELVTGKVLPESRDQFLRVISYMKDLGAEAVILGCTEIPLLVTEQDSPLPIVDTTAEHAKAAVDAALKC